MTRPMAAALLALVVATPASGQDLWGTLLLPGGVPSARRVVELGGDAGRIDEFFLLDFAHRVHGTPSGRGEPETLARYLGLLEQITAEAATWPGGFARPAPDAPRVDRDRAKHFLELLGLVLDDRTVTAGGSREARERQAWLAAAGVDTSTLLEPINAGVSVAIAVPQGELPLPLPQFWTTRNSRESALLSIAGSRESSLLYTGLFHVDSRTLQYLASRPALLTQIHARHAASFAAFGRSIQIHDGAVVPAGGDTTAGLWERLAGARLSSPEAFIPALLSIDDGRLAYFFDSVAHLSADRRAWILGPHVDDMYAVFRRVAPKWRVRDQPFFRPDLDPLMALLLVESNGGTLAAAPWWPSLFDWVTTDRAWPRHIDAVTPHLRDEPADARWLLTWLFAREDEAADRFRMFRAAQRMAKSADRSAAPQLSVLVRAVRDMPVLPPALERLGITDLQLAARFLMAARGLHDKGRGESLARLGRWQLMLTLLEQVAVRQRLTPARTAPLLNSLADWAADPSADTEGQAAAWLVDVLLPALAPGVSQEDAELFERDVIVDLAKRAPAGPGAPPIKVFWEGIEYVVDDTFATTRDVLTIRVSQHSPTLGDLVRLRRLQRRLEHPVLDLAGVEEMSADFTRAVSAMAKLRPNNGKELKSVSEFRKAERIVRGIADERETRKATDQLPRVRAALDAVFDGAMLPLVYALAMSPAGQSPATLLERPYWHTWEDAAWRPAVSEVGPFMETVTRGSVIGLDIWMADARLRSSGRALTVRTASVSPDERAAVLRTMRAHGEAVSWGHESARVLKALEAGSVVLAGSGTIDAVQEARMRTAGIDPARIALVRWQRERGVPAERLGFTRLDAYRLGSSEPLPAGWEGVGLAAEGSWITSSSSLWPVVEFTGRPSAGAGGAVATDVLLRLLEASRSLRLPPDIVPVLFPLVAHDWLNEVQQYSADDVRSLREWSRTITRERVESYMLGLVSARLLVRPARSQDQ